MVRIASCKSVITTKHVQLIMTLLPQLTRLGVLTNPGSLTRIPILNRLEEIGSTNNVMMMPIDVTTPAEIDRGLAATKRDGVDAVIVVADAFITSQLPQIAQLTFLNRLPSIFEYREYPEVGGLMSYGTRNSENLRRAAIFVDKTLKGAKPAELPMEQPTKFELIINLKIAKALAVEVPPKLVFTADEVIE